MTTQNKLLVLADGSDRILLTAKYLSEFRPFGEDAKIVLFHVFRGVPSEYLELAKSPTCAQALSHLSAQEQEEKRKVLANLDQAKSALVAGGYKEHNVEIKFHCLETGVASDIIEEAKDGYCAVVLRRRGLGALRNIIVGSVAVKLLQALTFLPIILVGQAPPVKKVLLAIDASPHSMKAVEFVGANLGGRDYEVCAFHAVEGLGAIRFVIHELYEKSSDQPPDVCIDAFKARIGMMFQAAKRTLLDAGFTLAQLSGKVVSGVRHRSDAIVQEAEDGGFSTIVVGRRGLSKIDAFFMGRVSHAVVYGGKHYTVWVV